MLNPKHPLRFPNLRNARDLGGYATRDGEVTRWQSLLRADDLAQLTPDGVQALLEYGVRTIIDLRWPAEAESQPSPFRRDLNGVHYVPISLLGESEATWRGRRPTNPKAMWNCIVLENAQPEIREVMRAIARAPAGGVLFHCFAGKDRTGVVAALLLALAEVIPEEIAHDYAISSDNLREAWLAASPDAEQAVILEMTHCPPEQVSNMLAHVERHYAGPSNYLRAVGLSEWEIRQIRVRLRVDGGPAG